MTIFKLTQILLCLGAISLVVAEVTADGEILPGHKYRVLLLNGREVVGEITETDTTYKVKSAIGITETFQKSAVGQVLPLEKQTVTDEESDRPAFSITQEELSDILGDEAVEDLYVWDYVEQADLTAPLDTDWESVEVMKRLAGRTAKVLETPHFVFVYTSPPEGARRLASRLETVWKWNTTFARMFNIPVKRPDHKLEVYYFNTFEEYTAYQTLNGFMEAGALGFYTHVNNRCAFYDMNTYPPVAAALSAASDPNLSAQERRKKRNEHKRWSDWTTLEVVQHEATHAIHFNIGVFPQLARLETWMVEGLCVQFEVTPSITGGSFGSINYKRLSEWREFYGERGENMPWHFVKNVVMSMRSGYHDYVMGWALNFYLRKEFKEGYSKWMCFLAERENNLSVIVPAAERLSFFEDCFGKLDEQWVADFCEFLAAIPMRESAIVKNPLRP